MMQFWTLNTLIGGEVKEERHGASCAMNSTKEGLFGRACGIGLITIQLRRHSGIISYVIEVAAKGAKGDNGGAAVSLGVVGG